MGRDGGPVHITERHEISEKIVAGAVAFQGRQSYMEDTFRIEKNINGSSDITMYAICDGHAGSFASQYTSDIIIPSIADKIGEIAAYLKDKILKIQKAKKEKKLKEIREPKEGKLIKEKQDSSETETEVEEENPLEKYLTKDNKIDYELLLHEEILNADKVLLDRMGRAALFCGTTLCLVVVDIAAKMIICANVGDSRAVMRDTRGNAISLSNDHKPDNLEEMKRIRESGGFISKKDGCWRLEGSLATSRALGDYPLKMKKVLIADPEIMIFKYKDFSKFPRFIIIGSDGLWDAFKNQEATDYIKEKLKETHFGARSLMKKAYGSRRSSDNISVIVIKFIKPKKLVSSFDPYVGTYEWLR